jgi:hypothetical protein
VSCIYNRGRLRSLDRQAVGLDRRSGAGLVGFLVFALDLSQVLAFADVRIRKGRTRSFLEIGILAVMSSWRVGL